MYVTGSYLEFGLSMSYEVCLIFLLILHLMETTMRKTRQLSFGLFLQITAIILWR